MKRQVVLLFTLLFFLVSAQEALSQINRRQIRRNNKRIANYTGRNFNFGKEKRYNQVGISLNAVNYYGDLSPRPSIFSSDISFTRPGIAVSFAHRFGPRYTLQAQFMYATLRGSDNDSADPTDVGNGIFRYQRNLSFRNQIKELSVVAVFDLFENQATYISRVKWTPYAFVGGAVFLSSPEAQAPATDLQGNPLAEAGEWVKLRDLGTEGQQSTLDVDDVNYGIKPYPLVQAAIPFGIGARLRLNEVIDFSADIGFRYTFTDYLDDVSQNYVDLDKLNSPLAQAMSYRTNELTGYPTNPIPSTLSGVSVQNGYGSEYVDNWRGSKADRDIYMVTSLRVTYILGATFHKAKFR